MHSDPSDSRVTDDDAGLEALLMRCLDAIETEGEPALDRILAAHPARAPELRARLERLRGLGLVDAELSTSTPDRLGGFRLIELLGRGGMGDVYLAEQEGLRRRVAVKIIRRGALASPQVVERFHREALAMARLDHPHAARVHACGEDAGLVFIAMELIPGRGLDEILHEHAAADTRAPLVELLRWTRDVARALGAAHELGLVHRDVKPSNIRVTPEGRAVLVDFGLARVAGEATLSTSGSFLGSPHYAAPEQVTGSLRAVGPATDVYGLGATIYEGATGRLPFGGDDGDSVERLFAAILNADPPRPRRLDPDISRDLETVLLKALEKDPARRYPDADAFADDLDALLGLRPVRARPPSVPRRVVRWTRRHRIATGAALFLMLSALTGSGLLVAERAGAAAERRREIAAVLSETDEELAAMQGRQQRAAELAARASELGTQQCFRYLDADEQAELNLAEGATRSLEKERQQSYTRALQRLHRAEKLGAEPRRVRRSYAELFYQQWWVAKAAGDASLATFYRDRVLHYDPDGPIAARTRNDVQLRLESVPPGAEVHLLGYGNLADLKPGSEPRKVPVPLGQARPPIAPGTFCLRVVRSLGTVQVDDLIVRLGGHAIQDLVLVGRGNGAVRRLDRLVAIDATPVRTAYEAQAWVELHGSQATAGLHRFSFERDGRRFTVEAEDLAAVAPEVASPAEIAAEGGVPATLMRHGVVEEVVLPKGTRARVTAAPLLLGPWSRAGVTPTWCAVDAEVCLIYLRKKGYDPVRLVTRFPVPSSGTGAYAIRLYPQESCPEGYTRLFDHGDPRDCWMADHELTCGEYLAFLNDPETQAEIAGAEAPIRIPRTSGRGYAPSKAFRKRSDGTWELTSALARSLPVAGVSWEDARAYAAWKTARARQSGSPFRFSLPPWQLWQRAGGAHVREFVFGETYRSSWVKSCFSTPKPAIEPVLSYPRDESVYGAFDLCGGVAEFCDGWMWQERRLRPVAGGSWADADADRFRSNALLGMAPRSTDGVTGFRLVAWRDGD